MANKKEFQVDQVNRKILEEIQNDARLSYSEIGRRVGLTPPAVAERIKRLEENGVINGIHARLTNEKLGRELQAFVKLRTQTRHYPAVLKLSETNPEIIECHHLTGEASFLIKVSAFSIQTLNELITRLSDFGETETSIILSSPMPRKNL